MSDLRLYAWEVCVALGIFGSGRSALRLLGFRERTPLVLSGVFGVSLWIALGGVLDLLHLLRPVVFFSMAGVGIVLLLLELRLRLRSGPPANLRVQDHFSVTANLLLAAAILMIAVMMAGGVRPLLWNFDDLQGYIALGVKALQMHSVQPDAFCERRVQAGVGGGNFLDTMMFAAGDIRAMPFIDSTLGLLLYALGLWTIARRWKASPLATAVALFCLPFATLIKVNLTIVYLSAAGLFAALLLLTELAAETRRRAGKIVALGIIVGALCTTKSPNIVFIVLFLLGAVLLLKVTAPKAAVLLPVGLSLLLAALVVLPWSIANKANAGTYLYPLLGKGIHVSAYHLIPDPAALGTLPHLVVLLTPSVAALALALLFCWKLTPAWPAPERAILLAYLIAALLGVPIIVYGLGGDGGDRYIVPFLMPALLLAVLVVGSAPAASLRFWRVGGLVALAATGAYVVLFLGVQLMWYRDIKVLAADAIGRQPEHYNPYLVPLDRAAFEQDLAYGKRIQATLPAGTTAIEDMGHSFIFDFTRNRILVQDHSGMASPAPGLPLNGTPADMRGFLAGQGIDYIIFDRQLYCGPTDWQQFLEHKRLDLGWQFFLHNQTAAHLFLPWGRAEHEVACHVREQMMQIAEQSPQVYNDGRVLVARIR